MKTILRYGLAALAIAGLMTANPAMAAKVPKEGVLHVEDGAGLFSRDGIKRAKDDFAQLKSEYERQVTIATMAVLPAADKDRLSKIDKENKTAIGQFWHDFTLNEAKGDRAKGVFILINVAHSRVQIIADKAWLDRGFDRRKEDQVRELLVNSFKAAKGKPDSEALALRDKGLLDATSYLREVAPIADSKSVTKAAEQKKKEGSNIMSYVCIGIAVLLGLWLVVGLIRAFTNRGGGGGGGPGGGGGGYGGGGGGFMSGMLGGLFGGLAGMWLYNNMFGGHTESSAWGGDNSVGDSGSAGESGTGDFSGDSGSGGDYGGGDTGGDTGGGGDWGGGGGGGDTGGGGGDWGGGGGDF